MPVKSIRSAAQPNSSVGGSSDITDWIDPTVPALPGTLAKARARAIGQIGAAATLRSATSSSRPTTAGVARDPATGR